MMRLSLMLAVNNKFMFVTYFKSYININEFMQIHERAIIRVIRCTSEINSDVYIL